MALLQRRVQMEDMPQERVDLSDLFHRMNMLSMQDNRNDGVFKELFKAAVDLLTEHPFLASTIFGTTSNESLYPISYLAYYGASLEDIQKVYDLFPQALDPSAYGYMYTRQERRKLRQNFEFIASGQVAEFNVLSFFLEKCPQIIVHVTDEECHDILEIFLVYGEQMLKKRPGGLLPSEDLVYRGDNKSVQQIEFEKVVLKILDLIPILAKFTLSRAANGGMPEVVIDKILEKSYDCLVVEYPPSSNASLTYFSARRVMNVIPRIEEFQLNKYGGMDDPGVLVSILESVASALNTNLKRVTLCLACDVLATSTAVRDALASLLMTNCKNLDALSFLFSRTCYYWHLKNKLEQKGFYSEDKTFEVIAKAIASRNTDFPGRLTFQGFHLADCNLLAPILTSQHGSKKVTFWHCSFVGEIMLKDLGSCRKAQSRQGIESLSIRECKMPSTTLRSMTKFLRQEANPKSFMFEMGNNVDATESAAVASVIRAFASENDRLHELSLEEFPDECIPTVLEALRGDGSCLQSLNISVRDIDDDDTSKEGADDSVGNDAEEGADEGVRKDNIPNVVEQILYLLQFHNATLQLCNIREPFSESDFMVESRTKEARAERRLCQRKMQYYLNLNRLGRKRARDSSGTTTLPRFVDLLANVLCQCKSTDGVNGEESDDDFRLLTFGSSYEENPEYDESAVCYLYGLLREKPSLWTTNAGDSPTTADSRVALNGSPDNANANANGGPSFYERESKRARLSS